MGFFSEHKMTSTLIGGLSRRRQNRAKAWRSFHKQSHPGGCELGYKNRNKNPIKRL